MFPLWYHVVPWKSTMENNKCSKPPISVIFFASTLQEKTPLSHLHCDLTETMRKTQTMRNAGGDGRLQSCEGIQQTSGL